MGDVLNANHSKIYAEYIIKSHVVTTEKAGKYAHNVLAKSLSLMNTAQNQGDTDSPENYDYLCGISGLYTLHVCWFSYSALTKAHREYIGHRERAGSASTGANMSVNLATGSGIQSVSGTHGAPSVQTTQGGQTHGPTPGGRLYTILRPDGVQRKECSQNDVKQVMRTITFVDKVYMWYNPVTRQGSGPGISLENIEQRFLKKYSFAYFDDAFRPRDQRAINPAGAPISSYKYSIIPSLGSSSPMYLGNKYQYSMLYNNVIKKKFHCGIIVPTEEEILYLYALVTWCNRPVGEHSWERIIFVPNGISALYSYMHTENCLLITQALRCCKHSFMLSRKILSSDFGSMFTTLSSNGKARMILPVEDSQQLYKMHIPYSLFLRSLTNLAELLHNLSMYKLFRPFFGRAIHNCFGSAWFSVIDTPPPQNRNRLYMGRPTLLIKLVGTFLKFREYAQASKAYAAPFWDANKATAAVPYSTYFMTAGGNSKKGADGKRFPWIYQLNTPYYTPGETHSFQPITDDIQEKIGAVPAEVAVNVQSVLKKNKEEGCDDVGHDHTSFLPIDRPILIVASNDDRIANWINELTTIKLSQHTIYCHNDPNSIDFVRRYLFTNTFNSGAAPNTEHPDCEMCKATECSCQLHSGAALSRGADNASSRSKLCKGKKDPESPIFSTQWCNNPDLISYFLDTDNTRNDEPSMPSTNSILPYETITLSAAHINTTYLAPPSAVSADGTAANGLRDIIARGYGSQFKPVAMMQMSADTKFTKHHSPSAQAAVKRPQPKALKATKADPPNSASEPRTLTLIEKNIFELRGKGNHLCAVGAQKGSASFIRKSQLLNSTDYYSRWKICSPTLTTCSCACPIFAGAWCTRCNLNFKTNKTSILDEISKESSISAASGNKPPVNEGTASNKERYIEDYCMDDHNYYIKEEGGDAESNGWKVSQEPLSQAFAEPFLKKAPLDTITFQRGGSRILSIRRNSRQLPACIIVVSTPALMKLIDLLAPIPFEAIFVEESLEMMSRQHENLAYCYNLTAKHRFFAGRKEFPTFISESLAKISSTPLTEKVPKDVLVDALLSLNTMPAETFQAALSILSFLLHIPRYTLLTVMQLIAEAAIPIFDTGNRIVKPMQILLIFALLDFLDANYLPEVIHSQITAAELAAYKATREKNAPSDASFETGRGLTTLQMCFAGYPREEVKVSNITEYNRKCDEFFSYIRAKAASQEGRHTPYRVFSVIFLHIQAYNFAEVAANIRIPAELLRHLNIALTPFGSIILGRNGDYLSNNNLVSTARCTCGISCGCGLFAHSPDYIQQLEHEELHANLALDHKSDAGNAPEDTATEATDVHKKIKVQDTQELLEVTSAVGVDVIDDITLSAPPTECPVHMLFSRDIVTEIRRILSSKDAVQPAFIVFTHQTFDRVLLQRVFLDTDINVRRILFDDTKPVILKKYTEIETGNSFPKVTYMLYSTVIRYTIFQLLVYIWSDTVISLGEQHNNFLKNNPSYFVDAKEGTMLVSPFTYPIYIVQSRLLHIAAIINSVLKCSELLLNYPSKMIKAINNPSPFWQAALPHTKQSLVFLVPDIMYGPLLQFLKYAYADLVVICDVQTALLSSDASLGNVDKLFTFLSFLEDEREEFQQLTLLALHRLFLSAFFNALFIAKTSVGSDDDDDKTTSNTSADNADEQKLPAHYHRLKELIDGTTTRNSTDPIERLIVSVVPESLILFLSALVETCASSPLPMLKTRGKMTLFPHDFTAMIAAIPFVGTRPVTHMFVKLCYEYQSLIKAQHSAAALPYIVQCVCHKSLEGSLLLAQQQSTHTLFGEVQFLAEALRTYVRKVCASFGISKNTCRADLAKETQEELIRKLSLGELLLLCTTSSCSVYQQLQANIGNQMSKLSEAGLNLKPSSMYLMNPLVKTTVNAWLDGDLILQGGIHHIFGNVKTTLQETVRTCKSKADPTILNNRSMAIVKQAAMELRSDNTVKQAQSIRKKEQQGSGAVDNTFDEVRLTLDSSPFYVYYANSQIAATIRLDEVCGRDIHAHSADSPSPHGRTKDVAGVSKMRDRASVLNFNELPALELEPMDKIAESVSVPDAFRGSSAFSAISGNVVGTLSTSMPVFSRIGRTFRKAEGPTFTPSELLYNYFAISVEQAQPEPSTQLTSNSLQNALSIVTQPPIPPVLDAESVLPPNRVAPRVLTARTRQDMVHPSKAISCEGNYISEYVSILNPSYVLDSKFPICQECYSMYTKAEMTALQQEKSRLVRQYGNKETGEGSLIFAVPKDANVLDYAALDSSKLYYCFVCENIFDPQLPLLSKADSKDVRTLVQTCQAKMKPGISSESVITPAFQSVFRQCKIYQRSSLAPQGKVHSNNIYQTNLSGLSYNSLNEYQSLCVQCIEEAGVPRPALSQIYRTVCGLLSKHMLYQPLSDTALQEYFLVYLAAAHSYVFTSKFIGYPSELRTPELVFDADTPETMVDELHTLSYKYQHLLYGHASCEFIRCILHSFLTTLGKKDSNTVGFMAQAQSLSGVDGSGITNYQVSALFNKVSPRAMVGILTSFFSCHTKKGTGTAGIQTVITNLSQSLGKIYLLFKNRTISDLIEFSIPYTLYPVYSPLHFLLHYRAVEKSILTRKWLVSYDTTELILHTLFKAVDTTTMSNSCSYSGIFAKYYVLFRMLLLDSSIFTLHHQLSQGIGAEGSPVARDDAAFLSFLLRHTMVYNHSILVDPDAACYSHILTLFSSILLAYNQAHPCRPLNFVSDCDHKNAREVLLNGELYGTANIFVDNIIVYYMLTHVPSLISMQLNREHILTQTQGMRHIRHTDAQEKSLCSHFLGTFSKLDFTVNHALADWGTVQFIPQLSYMHRLMRAKIRILSLSSPLSLVDTSLMVQYLNNNVKNMHVSPRVFDTLFSCDYSWVYKAVASTYQFELPVNQDILITVQSALEDDSPSVLNSSIAESFSQKLYTNASSPAAATCAEPFKKRRFGIMNIRPYPHSVPKIVSEQPIESSPTAPSSGEAASYTNAIAGASLESAPGMRYGIATAVTTTGPKAGPVPKGTFMPPAQKISPHTMAKDTVYSTYSISFNEHIDNSPLLTFFELPTANANANVNTNTACYHDHPEAIELSLIGETELGASPLFNSVASTQGFSELYPAVVQQPSSSKIQLALFQDNAIFSSHLPAYTLIPLKTLQGTAPIPTRALSYLTLRTLRMLFIQAYPIDNQYSIFYPQLGFSKVQGVLPMVFGDSLPDSKAFSYPSPAAANSVVKVIEGLPCVSDGEFINTFSTAPAKVKDHARLHSCESFLVIYGTNVHGGLLKHQYKPYQFENDHTELDTFFLRYLANYMYLQGTDEAQSSLITFLQDPVSGVSLRNHALVSTSMASNFMISGLLTDGMEHQRIDSLVKEFEQVVPEENRHRFIDIVTSIGVGIGTTPLEMYENIIHTSLFLLKSNGRILSVSDIIRAASALLQIIWLVNKKYRKIPDELRSYFINTDISAMTYELYRLRILQAKMKELSVRYNYFVFAFDWCAQNKHTKYGSIFSRGLQNVQTIENYWIQCCNQYNEDFTLQDLMRESSSGGGGGVKMEIQTKPSGSADGSLSPETAVINDIACSPAALAFRFLWSISYYLPSFYYSRSSTSSPLSQPQSQDICGQNQGQPHQAFSIIRQHVLKVHPVACAVDLAVTYIDFMYECMIDPSYLQRYQTTPITMTSLFTVQEYGLTELKNCWLYLAYCKIEFLEKFGLSLPDIRALEKNPELKVTREDIDLVQSVATSINAAWSRLSDLKMLHAYIQFRGKYHQALMEKKEYSCAQTINTIQLAKILLPIFKQLTQLLEATYNGVFLSKDISNLLFPTEALVQQGIRPHPALEERWNVYYVHAIQWQAVMPAFSDSFLANFDIMQRPRRVPTPELIAFAIRQFSMLVKDRKSSILQGIRVPVSADFLKYRQELLVQSIMIERTLLVNLNEQYYNYDLNSIMNIARATFQTTRSHVKLIADGIHPADRCDEITNRDSPMPSYTAQTMFPSQLHGGMMPEPPQYQQRPRSLSAGAAPYQQQYMQQRGSYYPSAGSAVDATQPVYHPAPSSITPNGSRLISDSNNSGFYQQRQGIGMYDYIQRQGQGQMNQRSYSSTLPQIPTPTAHMNIGKLSPHMYPLEQGYPQYQQYYQTNNNRSPIMASGPRYPQAFNYDQPASMHKAGMYQGGMGQHQPQLLLNSGSANNPMQVYSSRIATGPSYSGSNAFGGQPVLPEELTPVFPLKATGNSLSLASYTETISAVLRLLNNTFPLLIRSDSTLETSERALFTHIYNRFAQDNMMFELPASDSIWQCILGYLSLVREPPPRKDELGAKADSIMGKIVTMTERYPEVVKDKNQPLIHAFCKGFEAMKGIKKSDGDQRILMDLGQECAIFILHQAYTCAYEVRRRHIERNQPYGPTLQKMREYLDLCLHILSISDMLSYPDILTRKYLLLVLFIRAVFKQ